MTEEIEHCKECRHPLIWHARADWPGRCCDCTSDYPGPQIEETK